MKYCPRCGLIVDERFRYCEDCGYDWADPEPTFLERISYRWNRHYARETKLVLMFLAAVVLLPIVGCVALRLAVLLLVGPAK